MRVTLNLTREEYDALQRMADQERRPLKQQAELFIAKAVARSGPSLAGGAQ